MTINLPWPPSANTYYRRAGHVMHLSPKGRKYRDDVLACIWADGILPKISGRIRVSIIANPPDRRKRDIDNIIKPLLDSLTIAGVWFDDSQIDHLEIVRTAELTGDVTVMIEEISPVHAD